ncbi:MAG: fimbrillin family protein [Bacteroidales bacterium]|nr:fimbrillin family protein [Bacteroidales bacterium]
MKKITLLTIFGLALMALSACNKEEVTASRTLKLDLNIIHDSDTKAVKTGWESGDKIYVFFGKPADHTTPAYLTLTYNGSTWTEDWTAGLEAEIASTASGTLHAVYTPGKLGTMSYSTYLKTYQFFDGDAGWYLKCENVNYTVSEGVLAATLNMARPSNFVQFYLEGQAANAGKLQFSGDKILKVKVSSISETGFKQGSHGYGSAIDGVAYKGGLMFSGILKSDARGIETSHTLKITDTKGTVDKADDVVYTITATKKMKVNDAFVLPALDNAAWTVTP